MIRLLNHSCYVVLLFIGMLGCGQPTRDAQSTSNLSSTQAVSHQAEVLQKVERPTEPARADFQVKSSDVSANSAAARIALESLPNEPRNDDMRAITEEAKVFFDNLVGQFPTDHDAFDTRARYYFLIGDHEIAKASWQEALRLNSRDPFSQNGLGLIHQANDDLESAVRCFQLALMEKPNDPSLMINITKSLVKLGRLDEAIQTIRTCTQSNPDSVEAWELLGQSCQANQAYEQANEAFSQAVRRAPNSFISQQGMAASLIRLDRKDDAAKWLELQKTSRSQLKTEQTPYAVTETRKVGQLLSLAANVYIKHRKNELAISTMRYAVACSPNEESPKQSLIELYQRLDRIEDAIAVAKDLVQAAPERLGFRFGLADLYARRKNWSMAERSLNEAAALEPNNPQCYIMIAKLLLANGLNSKRLVEVSQTTVKLRGNAADYALLAQAYHANGNTSGAIEALKSAMQKNPDNASLSKILRQLEAEKPTP
jgi:tetratricopeptide (TPR) repeat protein